MVSILNLKSRNFLWLDQTEFSIHHRLETCSYQIVIIPISNVHFSFKSPHPSGKVWYILNYLRLRGSFTSPVFQNRLILSYFYWQLCNIRGGGDLHASQNINASIFNTLWNWSGFRRRLQLTFDGSFSENKKIQSMAVRQSHAIIFHFFTFEILCCVVSLLAQPTQIFSIGIKIFSTAPQAAFRSSL